MTDLTVVFLTINRVPSAWADYHRSVLVEAAGGADFITASRVPVDLGVNIIQEEPFNEVNIYRQLLRAALLAKTKYIAVAEDDVLYSREHFSHRPADDVFAYDMARWGIFTWGEPTYYWKDRISNAVMISTRDLLVKCLERRFARSSRIVGELGKARIDRALHLPERKVERFYAEAPVVYFSHDRSLDRLEVEHRKRMAPVRAYDIPYWGKASDLVAKFR